jgi:hypothetical protein
MVSTEMILVALPMGNSLKKVDMDKGSRHDLESQNVISSSR